MELTLTYQPDHHDTPAAVFLRGSDTRWWLEHFRVWGLLPEDVTLLPLSAADGTSVAGLFVIFKEDKTPSVSLLPEPFVLTGKKMFIPHGASLQPAMTDAELNTLCIWKYQLLHPSLGFFGLEEEDVLQAESLVLIPAPVVEEWSNLIQDVSQLPMLTSIRVEMPEEDAFMQEVKNVGDKALGDMPAPKGQPKTLLGKIWRFILYWLLRLVKGLLSFFVVTGPVTSGFMGRLMEQINTKLSTMGSWFESDEDRLLRLFRENPELALQFAPPLDPNARPGGGGASGGNWMQRNTRFNSGLLDWAGSSGGAWVIADNSYAELQNHYRKAAAEAEKQGDWSRAAYIYAHLLKEYHAAATALRKGKYYADAANIYLNQLDNLHKAAECYEEGGMYPEAIALYLKMELYEKAGDLHVLNGDPKAAAECFEKTVAYDLKRNNYLSAAKTIRNKLNDHSRAMRCLLNGWYSRENMEDCMLEYLRHAHEPRASMLHLVYERMLKDEDRMKFLTVLNRSKDEFPEVKEKVRDLAYRLIGDSIRDGEKHLLPMLANLVPGDPFLRSDAALFQSSMPAMSAKPKTEIKDLQLWKDVFWHDAFSWQKQVVVIGNANGNLILARCNWEGEVTYVTTNISTLWGTRYMISSHDSDKRVLIYSESLEDELIELPASTLFGESLHIELSPGWMPKFKRIGRIDEDFVFIVSKNDENVLEYYKLDGSPPVPIVIIETLFQNEEPDVCFYWKDLYIFPDSDKVIVHNGNEILRIFAMPVKYMCQNKNFIAWWTDESREVWYMDVETLTPVSIAAYALVKGLKFVSDGVLAVYSSHQSMLCQIDNKRVKWERDVDGKDINTVIQSGARGRFAMLQKNSILSYHDLPEEDI